MGTHVIEVLTCDVTGERGDETNVETILFGLDGKVYEMDAVDKVIEEIREVLERYIPHARPVRPATSKTRPSSDPELLAKIRAWAADNGYEVAPRGRISNEIREAYRAGRPNPNAAPPAIESKPAKSARAKAEPPAATFSNPEPAETPKKRTRAPRAE